MKQRKLNILFIHQNMPAQFKFLAPMLAAQGHRVLFLTRACRAKLPGVTEVIYPAPRGANPETHLYVRGFEEAVLHGQAVVRAIGQIQARGFKPDLIIAHPGWGEALFLKDVLPDVPLITFAELGYRGHGLDVGFDPEETCTLSTICRARARNAHLMLSLEAADAAVSPTLWQKASHPDALQSKIDIIFDGIDTDIVRPRAQASVMLPDGRIVRRGDPVITYVARNLEPYRGFRTFMRAIPLIQQQRPDADIIIVGGDKVSYGRKPTGFANWREAMEAEVRFDKSRVHFLGRAAYDDYLSILAISGAHAYLTYPFVLSWSCMEALAIGALVVASDTGPVREVIRDGENGLLTDFFDAQALADKLVGAINDPARYETVREAAVRTVQERYSLEHCLPQWNALIDRVMAGRGAETQPVSATVAQLEPRGNRTMRRRAEARQRAGALRRA
jgi:glycosyltransferase involved in cell wall biosynthesis